jgi:hypothetical protein
MTAKFLMSTKKFVNQTDILNSDTMWYAVGKSDFVVACHWHHTWMLARTKVPNCNWKQVKKINYEGCANLENKVIEKITNIYGQYQQVKSPNRDDQRSSVGRLWTEWDLHCMKMDVFCADIADSLDTDARI